ncbi:MAG: carboxypeptidase-like regulatory domain-containing protein [Flavobacteriales bacterium]|nr:carboxypeptidase-like regulatory domain-containing protein [Flavobacteriales bacterium]
MRFIALFIILTVCLQSFFGQNLSGFVQDETNAGIPFVNIYVKNLGTGTTTNGDGKYFLRFNDPGVYDVVFSSIGYETQEIKIIFKGNEDLVKNVWLKTDENELDEIIINSKRRDPAYGIIANAINQKERWNNQFQSSKCQVYIKAKELISEKEKKKREKEAQEEIEAANNSLEEDVFETEDKKKQAEEKVNQPNMNMVEIDLIRYFEQPNKVKEIRNGYKKYGSSYGLYFLNTSEAVFNFYDNLMSLDNLNELPLVSPLHFSSVLTYKFKLEETVFEGERKIYKIKVTPRKAGNASWEGYIWIMDKSFNITRTDLSLSKGGLLIYDDFNIKQDYIFIEDSIQVLKKQEFTYSSKTSKTDFNGNTTVNYSKYELNPEIDKKFFRNEVAVTTQEAYEKDSTYWQKIRPEPLSVDEQNFQRIKDSIYAYQSSDRYLDSIDSVFNKVTLMNVLWDGIEFSNRKKKEYWYFSSIAGLLDPFEIGGLRVGPSINFFKKWKNEKYLSTNASVDMGIRNQDFKYYFNVNGRYDPMHFGYMGATVEKQFNIIVQNDAVSNLLLRSNWIEEERFVFYTSRELWNGFFVNGKFTYTDRFPIDQYKFNAVADDWFDGSNVPLDFTNYQSTNLALSLSYTPFQKYMTEPKRKIILGSKWPTFTFYTERGIPKLLGSDIDYTYISGQVEQSFKIGTLGTSTYKIRAGKFINTNDLRYVDQVIFPRGDQWFFASLMESMQIQDTSLTVRDSYYRAHFVHHFNGAIVNYIPYVKKLGIHAVVGTSTLYIKESKYRYLEGFVGLEKVFKVQRSRIRLGVYFVEAVSNYSSISPRIKFAINRYSLRDKNWGY